MAGDTFIEYGVEDNARLSMQTDDIHEPQPTDTDAELRSWKVSLNSELRKLKNILALKLGQLPEGEPMQDVLNVDVQRIATEIAHTVALERLIMLTLTLHLPSPSPSSTPTLPPVALNDLAHSVQWTFAALALLCTDVLSAKCRNFSDPKHKLQEGEGAARAESCPAGTEVIVREMRWFYHCISVHDVNLYTC